ncbi:MAG: hypothetical protein IPO08_20255 [Xanthomonadales bacterium]|nr:hypothetical protein [Xanthomonadales bacterium]
MTNCDVVFLMGSFTSWCNAHESKADTERQCCMTGMAERSEAAERERDEARAELERVKAERDEAINALKLCANTLTEYAEADSLAGMENSGTFSYPGEFISNAIQAANKAMKP